MSFPGQAARSRRFIPFRLVPALDQYEWSVRLAQKPAGKLLLLAVYAGLLTQVMPNKWIYLIPCLFAFSFLPEWRSLLLVFATLGSVMLGFTNYNWNPIKYIANTDHIPIGFMTEWTAWVGLALTLIFCSLLVRMARGWGRFRLNRPVVVVLTVYSGLFCVVSYLPLPLPLHFALWTFLLLFNKYIWFLAYSLVEARTPENPAFIRQIGHYQPFWYPSTLPIPKGASYLRSIEAKTPEDLAITQLKGLKLLYWGVILWFFTLMIQGYLFGSASEPSRVYQIQWQAGSLDLLRHGAPVISLAKRAFPFLIPPYQSAFNQCISGSPFPIYQSWMSLVTYFFIDILQLAAITHVGISLCRMCGYRALRNVCNPLASKDIAEFWNRYYYYFKELLLHIFFYPTFFRYFKKNHPLRLFFATMVAVFVGNFSYHLFLNPFFIYKLGFFKAIWAYQTFLFYCFVLGTGIYVSQWRKTFSKKRGSLLPTYLKPLPVLSFYCIITIFADHRHESIEQNFKFLLYLFGVDI